MNEQTVQKILESYGIRNAELQAMQKGYRNETHPFITADNKKLNLIIYKSEPGILDRIHNANRVADYAAVRNLPVRKTVDSRILTLRNKTSTKYSALYTYLPGTTIAWESYTMEHIKTLGGTMGTLHAVLNKLTPAGLPLATDEYMRNLQNMELYFSDPGVIQAANTKLGLNTTLLDFEYLQKIIYTCSKLQHKQPLHMDFVRGNILFEGKMISGILDFEKTAYGHPILDIARTLAFLYVDCSNKSRKSIQKYFLHSGYVKRGGQKFVTMKYYGKDFLDELVLVFLVYDFYKFLLHNPYEYLKNNHHFVRTRDILLERNILTKEVMIKY